jgi:RHS repeat-associated protein
VPLGTNTVTVQATDGSGDVQTNTYTVTSSATGGSYSYDANGNLLTKSDSTENWVYTWNALNQLTKVTLNGSTAAQFTYDPVGRRVQKVAGAATTNFTYDGPSILRQVSGVTTLTYVNGLGIDEPLAFDTGTALSFYHADALGSIVAMTNGAGTVTQTMQYDAYGNLQPSSGVSGYSFTGRDWDPETNLYYYRARYYDPTLGRFLSEDPIGPNGGLNFYAYVLENPVKLRDPFGLKKWSDAECSKLWAEILGQAVKFAKEFESYDPIADTQSWPMRWGTGKTKSGGHYEELENLRKGLKNRIADWMNNCFDPNSPCALRRNPIPRWVDTISNYDVPKPVVQPPPIFFLPEEILEAILAALAAA